ncbi:collagen-like protein, partial [Chitinophaga sp.]|uniref:collagen-like triple helix repeat-containing protein n=1 Tax=Chitinophaga sp. TaxID=1869181 RepID=UPI002F9413E1
TYIMKTIFFEKGRMPMFLIAIVVITHLLIITGCSKKGDPGPAGANGAQGPAGPVGPKGPGAISGTFTLVNADYKNDYWTISTGAGGALGAASRAVVKSLPAITTDVFNTGTVMVYLKTPVNLSATATVWTPLPYDIRNFNVGYLTSFKFNYEAGKLRIYYMFVQTDGSATVPDIYNAVIPSYDYKYVVIPGTAAARASSPVDLNDYNAVAKYYNLKD